MDKGTEIQIEVEKNKIVDAGQGVSVAALSGTVAGLAAVVGEGTGVTGTITTATEIVTVTNGIITDITSL